MPIDIKDIWNPARLGSTFPLARAFALTGDERYVECWWGSLESWMTANPPYLGPNWRCGQEASLRGIAICFGLSTFCTARATSAERWSLATALLATTAARVRPTIGYGLSQRNNHAISELTFLLALAPQDALLVRLLQEALDDQFYEDGSYSQQSLVYERLALDALLWLLHVQPLLPTRLVEDIRARLVDATSLLVRCSDPVGGLLPNYGANDGSLLLDLAVADNLDGRPLLALLGVDQRGHPSEPAIWLPPATIGLPGIGSARQPRSTYRTLIGPRSILVTRIGRGRHRAGDDDQQAVEIILDGARVVLDPGSFRYTADAPWGQPFVGVEAHSVARPAIPQARFQAGRFLRDPMPAASVLASETGPGQDLLISERVEGGVRLTRGIVRLEDTYTVVDTADGGDAVVHWLLAAGTVEGNDFAFDGARAREIPLDSKEPTSGWWSPTYAELARARAFDVPLADGGIAMARFAPWDVGLPDPARICDVLAGSSDIVRRLSSLLDAA